MSDTATAEKPKAAKAAKAKPAKAKTTKKDDGKVSMKVAAEQLLTEAGGPMRSDDITDLALERKMIKTSGKTPHATMAAQLSVAAKDSKSKFLRTVPGAYGLRGRDKKGQKPKVTEDAAAAK